MSAKQTVEDLIANNKVIVFSKTWCPYSKKAKELLQQITPEGDLKVVELDTDADGDALHAYLREKTSQSSVPNIFINKQHIGGNDTLQAKHQRGEIVPLIQA